MLAVDVYVPFTFVVLVATGVGDRRKNICDMNLNGFVISQRGDGGRDVGI